MIHPLEKVTIFILRTHAARTELLLFQHPYAGVQLPAGTVEPGETPLAAAARETREETGLDLVQIRTTLGTEEETLAPTRRVLLTRAKVYARPDVSSFDWAVFPRGIEVDVLRQANGFTQVRYEEPDRWPDPHYATMQIMGWVHDEALSNRRKRTFYLAEFEGNVPDRWQVTTDSHDFMLFWAPADALPPLVGPQEGWLRYLRQVSF